MSGTGGWTAEKPLSEEGKKICMEVKPEIEKAARTKFPVYTPISIRHEVVAGINYLVKVCVGEDVCVHAMIFEDFQRTLRVTGVKCREPLNAPLVPF